MSWRTLIRHNFKINLYINTRVCTELSECGRQHIAFESKHILTFCFSRIVTLFTVTLTCQSIQLKWSSDNATGLTTEGPWYSTRQLSLRRSIQTGSWTHPGYCQCSYFCYATTVTQLTMFHLLPSLRESAKPFRSPDISKLFTIHPTIRRHIIRLSGTVVW